MIYNEKLKSLFKFLKITSLLGGGALVVGYSIHGTSRSIKRIVNSSVLDVEKKHNAEYIYIDDPQYNIIIAREKDKELKRAIGLARLWKSVKHSLEWRLLWLCKHGKPNLRDFSLEQLASFTNNKIWDCTMLAQAMDARTAVLLARTRGSDLRYFLPAPVHIRREALKNYLIYFTFHDMIMAVQNINPHSCIEHFLSKYFINVQEENSEVDVVAKKPNSVSEKQLCIMCIEALHHHLSLFHSKNFEEDTSTRTLLELGLLPRLAELLIRYPEDKEMDLAVLNVCTILSVHKHLLNDFYQNGLIRELARMIRSHDVRLSSSAAVCLTNLSGEGLYRPGLYLLHPIYRSRKPTMCDTMLVHGLQGGVFVTWRQRDRTCSQPLGIIEVTFSDIRKSSCEKKFNNKFIDPDMKEVVDDIIEFEDEYLLSDFEVVLSDIPIDARRENAGLFEFTTHKKRSCLLQEHDDRCTYTFCWPKDWLPNDCSNLRVMGINYWSSLSDWFESCPLLTADIETRASELLSSLIDAKVGGENQTNIPIVWLAHSMGGLITKQVLIQASENKDQVARKVCENTKGLLFYATPHRGSALASMPRAAAAVLWPSSDVQQLQSNSSTLLTIHEKFIQLADQHNWETVSFAETLPTLITAFKVPVHFVETESADLGRGVFYQLPLDHLCICKPETRSSIIYTTVLEVMTRATAGNSLPVNSNPFFDFVVKVMYSLLGWIPKNFFADPDDVQDPDGLMWIERLLIDTFTDGFRD